MRLKRAFLIAAAVVIALPITAFAGIKPLRLIAPGLMPGVVCPSSSTVCTDDLAALSDAKRLYSQGYQKAEAAVGPFRSSPRVVFCSSPACAGVFGVSRSAGKTVGTLGTAIAPRGWTSFYLAHEFIHHRQAEELGAIALLTKPKWLIEGMAYSLSDDPRHPLNQPFEDWRSQFEAWHAQVGSRNLWEAARNVH